MLQPCDHASRLSHRSDIPVASAAVGHLPRHPGSLSTPLRIRSWSRQGRVDHETIPAVTAYARCVTLTVQALTASWKRQPSIAGKRAGCWCARLIWNGARAMRRDGYGADRRLRRRRAAFSPTGEVMCRVLVPAKIRNPPCAGARHARPRLYRQRARPSTSGRRESYVVRPAHMVDHPVAPVYRTRERASAGKPRPARAHRDASTTALYVEKRVEVRAGLHGMDAHRLQGSGHRQYITSAYGAAPCLSPAESIRAPVYHAPSGAWRSVPHPHGLRGCAIRAAASGRG